MTEINGLPTEPAQQKSGGLDWGSIVLIIGILSVISVVGWQLTQQNQTQPTDGTAPDFTFTTFDDQTMRLSDLRGEIVVLNFWGSWCTPCRAEAPDLQRVHERYSDEGVRLLGITYIDEPDDSLEFIEEFGLTYTNAPDLRSDVSDLYNIEGAPETFVIDRDGEVFHHYLGAVDDETLSTLLDALLAEDDSV
jgi:cytochrome c biogenesis protein CcmG, thiol:disulfide interchange protein DsbE